MRIKLGPMTVNYQGAARLAAVDEAQRTADIAVEVKEAKGQGTPSAVIRNRVISENGATRVVAETDLNVTGRQAQFGRGIMQDVASRMLGQFAARFEAYPLEGDAAPEAGAGDDPAASTGAPAGGHAFGSAEDDVLDMGSVLSQTPAVRYAAASGGAVVLVAGLALALPRRNRCGTYSLQFSL